MVAVTLIVHRNEHAARLEDSRAEEIEAVIGGAEADVHVGGAGRPVAGRDLPGPPD